MEKVRGSNRMPATSTNPHTLFKKGKITRGEYILLNRKEKNERKDKRRERLGLPAIKSSFDMNNEKIWFKKTFSQTRSHLIREFVHKLKSFRFTLDKLNQTDVTTLSEKEQKSIEKKKLRCTNGEKLLEKEMYLLKEWNADDVFNMLLEHEPIPFEKACQLSLDTGNMTYRTRERIRNNKLVEPVWKRINSELKLFEEDRTLEEGQSKAKQLSDEMIENSGKIAPKVKPDSLNEINPDSTLNDSQPVEEEEVADLAAEDMETDSTEAHKVTDSAKAAEKVVEPTKSAYKIVEPTKAADKVAESTKAADTVTDSRFSLKSFEKVAKAAEAKAEAVQAAPKAVEEDEFDEYSSESEAEEEVEEKKVDLDYLKVWFSKCF